MRIFPRVYSEIFIALRSLSRSLFTSLIYSLVQFQLIVRGVVLVGNLNSLLPAKKPHRIRFLVRESYLFDSNLEFRYNRSNDTKRYI